MLQFTDWLGLSLRLATDPVATPANHVWQHYSGTNVWNKRQILYSTEGDKVCTLLWQPKSTVIRADAALLEVENEWLYHGLGVQGVLDHILHACNYEVLGMSRLDLAVDFVPDAHQCDVIEGLADGRYYVQGKRNGSGFWSVNTPRVLTEEQRKRGLHPPQLHEFWLNRRIPHCLSWGHKTSSVRWKLYYKSKELLDAGKGLCYDKPYIVDKWRAAGYDISNVWRLEVSIHNCNRLDFLGDRLSFGQYLEQDANIYTALYTQRFVVREDQGHQDKTNDRIVPFLPITSGFKGISQAGSKTLAEKSPRLTMLRHLVKDMEDPAVFIDDTTRENTLWLIEQMVVRDGLQNYFKAMTDEWLEDYIENQRVRAADLQLHPDHKKEAQATEWLKARHVGERLWESGDDN